MPLYISPFICLKICDLRAFCLLKLDCLSSFLCTLVTSLVSEVGEHKVILPSIY